MPHLPSRQRRLVLLIALLIALVTVAASVYWGGARGSASVPGAPARQPPPNVLLISIDTVRPDHLGCYGYGKPTSPNLDRFARQAYLFTQARCQAPWTLPSHMSLFTSMLPSSNGVDYLYNTLPPDIPTLAEQLKHVGYHTAGIVNDGQMQAIWGFARGHDVWREFPAEEPQGAATNITAQALAWLDAAPPKPWYLFLHYYDAHDPYRAPESFRQRFGGLPAEDNARLMWEHYRPEQAASAADIEKLIASYDASIAYMDDELGKVLERVPENTLVVIFSDHGEAFEEHGWTWHGSTLYEEEIRCVLMVRPPGGAEPLAIDEPVMLLDVAPTILSYCGIDPPPHYEGTDLRPLFAGQALATRPMASETKSLRAGRLSKAIIEGPWKLIYDMHTGEAELYRLPDEQANLVARETERGHALLAPMRAWVSQESFWLITATGPGEKEMALQVPMGQFAVAVPLNIDPDRDGFRIDEQARTVRLRLEPGEADKAVFLQLVPADAPLGAAFIVDGQPRPERVAVGRTLRRLATLPVEFRTGAAAASSSPGGLPVVRLEPSELLAAPTERPPSSDDVSFYVWRYQSGTARPTHRSGVALDRDTREQLRSLGYLQ